MPLISDTEVYGSVYVQGWDSMVYTRSFRTVSATKRPSLKKKKEEKESTRKCSGWRGGSVTKNSDCFSDDLNSVLAHTKWLTAIDNCSPRVSEETIDMCRQDIYTHTISKSFFFLFFVFKENALQTCQ